MERAVSIQLGRGDLGGVLGGIIGQKTRVASFTAMGRAQKYSQNIYCVFFVEIFEQESQIFAYFISSGFGDFSKLSKFYKL